MGAAELLVRLRTRDQHECEKFTPVVHALNEVRQKTTEQRLRVEELQAGLLVDIHATVCGWKKDEEDRALYNVRCFSASRGKWSVYRSYSQFEGLCVAMNIPERMPPKY